MRKSLVISRPFRGGRLRAARTPWAEADRLATDEHLVLADVELMGPPLKHILRAHRLACPPAAGAPAPSNELPDRERLRDVVVRPDSSPETLSASESLAVTMMIGTLEICGSAGIRRARTSREASGPGSRGKGSSERNLSSARRPSPPPRPHTPLVRGCSAPCPRTIPGPPHEGARASAPSPSRSTAPVQARRGRVGELAELSRDRTNLFSDVDGVIADTLEGAGRQVHVEPPVERARIVCELERFEMRRAVKSVDRIVHLRELRHSSKSRVRNASIADRII